MKSKRRYKRGYPVAVLIGLDENLAVLWKVFSKVVKCERTIRLDGTRRDEKALYRFHERAINGLRPALKEGVHSVVIASPAKSSYSKSFLNHIQLHHVWLVKGASKVSISEVAGSACTLPNVASLVNSPVFRKMLSETVLEETEVLVELLEKRLNASGRGTLVFYSLCEIHDLIFSGGKPGKPKPDFLLITDAYLSSFRPKNKLHRLMQVAANRAVKVKIVDGKSPAGARVTQFGGIILLATAA